MNKRRAVQLVDVEPLFVTILVLVLGNHKLESMQLLFFLLTLTLIIMHSFDLSN